MGPLALLGGLPLQIEHPENRDTVGCAAQMLSCVCSQTGRLVRPGPNYTSVLANLVCSCSIQYMGSSSVLCFTVTTIPAEDVIF